MIDFNGKITTFFSIMQVFLIYSEFTPNFVRFTRQTYQFTPPKYFFYTANITTER